VAIEKDNALLDKERLRIKTHALDGRIQGKCIKIVMKGNGVGEIIDLNKVMREQELLKANEERIAAFNFKQE
jgi:hypothetical protein